MQNIHVSIKIAKLTLRKLSWRNFSADCRETSFSQKSYIRQAPIFGYIPIEIYLLFLPHL